jgi:hypothetical protein
LRSPVAWIVGDPPVEGKRRSVAFNGFDSGPKSVAEPMARRKCPGPSSTRPLFWVEPERKARHDIGENVRVAVVVGVGKRRHFPEMADVELAEHPSDVGHADQGAGRDAVVEHRRRVDDSVVG